MRLRVCVWVERSRFCASVWEYCRDRFTVARVGHLSSRTFILGRFVSVSNAGRAQT